MLRSIFLIIIINGLVTLGVVNAEDLKKNHGLLETITSDQQTSQTVVYEVQIGDTLGKLAKNYGTTIDLIKKRNNLNSDIIQVGQRLSIWTGKFNIFVSKSKNILELRNDGQVVKTYTVSTGKDTSVTPVGEFTIVNKLIDPVWFNNGVTVPAGSPTNALGTRWLGFNLPSYGISRYH